MITDSPFKHSSDMNVIKDEIDVMNKAFPGINYLSTITYTIPCEIYSPFSFHYTSIF